MDGEDVALIVFAAAPLVTGWAALRYLRRARAAAAGGRPRRGPLVAGNVLVLAFLLSLACLLGECWFRFAVDATDAYGMRRATSRWMQRHYEFNNEKFRDDVDYDFGLPPKGARRITFIGDSFTAGHGVPNVDDRFANRVRAARPGWEVHVLAANGADTGQELTLLDELPVYTQGRYRYDVVVLVYCLNDVADITPEVGAMFTRLTLRGPRGFLARCSYLFDEIRFRLLVVSEPELGDYYGSIGGAYAGPLWDVQKQRLRKVRESVAARGGRLAVITFPFVNDLGPGYRFRDVHRQLAEFWKEEGVPELDLLDTFDGRDARDLVVGRFDAHPNERAHEIAAAAIVPFLERVLEDR